jgi:hypothetical protein
MKTTILLLFLAITSCNKDSVKQDPVAQLPPETQTGTNTFGVTINGKVYIPRTPSGINVGGTPQAIRFWRSPDDEHIYDELEVVDGASTVGFKIIIHLQNLFLNGNGQYVLKQSNFQEQGYSIPFNQIFFKIWDAKISNYAYYGSIENEGVINVNRYDFTNRIFSGNFSGKFVRYDNPNEFITITDGRFDINWNTIQNHPFP